MTAKPTIPFCCGPARKLGWKLVAGLTIGVWAAGFACIAGAPFTIVQRQICLPPDSESVVPANRIRSIVYGRNLEVLPKFIDHHGPQSSDLELLAPDRAEPDYDVTRWAVADGLPADKIGALIQTRDGYLWVGTVGGLVRFDGVQFRSFERSLTKDDASTNIVARAFHEDANGHLWVGTKDELLRHENEGFASYTREGAPRESRISGFATRSDGGFWLATDSGIEFWDGARLQRLETTDLSTPFCLQEDGRGALWIGSMGGLYRYDLKKKQIDQHLHRDLLHGRPDRDSRIFGLEFDPDGNLWLGASHGTSDSFDSSALRTAAPLGDTTQFAFVFPVNARLAEGRSRMMWVAPQHQGGKVYGYPFGDRAPARAMHTIESEARDVRSIIEDREGAVWFGGRNGLFRARRRPCASLTISQDKSPVVFDSVSVGEAGSLQIVTDSTMAGVWSGRHLEFFETGSPLQTLAFVIGPGPQGRLWSGHLSGGLVSLGRRSSMGLEFSCDFRPIASDVGKVFGFHVTRDLKMWVLADLGLFLWDGSNARRVGPAELVRPTCVDEDPEGRIWVGTAGGVLFRGESASLGFSQMPLWNPLGQGGIQSVLGVGDDIAWLGLSQGLALYHLGRVVMPDAKRMDLPQGAIDTLLRDHLGRLWLGHSRGIARVNLDSQPGGANWSPDRLNFEVTHFGGQEGVLDTEPSTGWPRGGTTPEGRLWFARRTALVTVDPAELERREAPPLVYIEAVAGTPLLNRPATALALPPGSGESLLFEFTTTSLLAPERGRLEYRLEGRDTLWREAGMERSANYHGLAPGEYQFRVRARNHEGRWCESEATLALRLLPHYWQTTGFRLGMAAAGTLGLFAGLRWFLTRQSRHWEGRRREAVDAERIRIARDLHDQLGAALAESALVESSPKSDPLDRPEVLRELSAIIWAIHPENDTLPSFGDFIADYSCRYLARAGIEARLDVPLHLPALELPSALRSDLTAMFKEALRNVVCHAGATRATIELAVQDGSLALVITDNGCGIRAYQAMASHMGGGASPLHGGQGLRNMADRCRHWRGDFRISATPAGGTLVRIQLPFDTQSR